MPRFPPDYSLLVAVGFPARSVSRNVWELELSLLCPCPRVEIFSEWSDLLLAGGFVTCRGVCSLALGMRVKSEFVCRLL